MSELVSGERGGLLLVGGDAARHLIETALNRDQNTHALIAVSTAAEALIQAGAARPDLVISDRTLPDATGADLVRRMGQIHADLPVWIVEAATTNEAEAACESMQSGAADYLALGPGTLAKLPFLIAKTVAMQHARRRRARADTPRDLSSIAHEVRSPLAALNALVELMEGGVDGPLSPSQTQRVARIRAALQKLNGVVDGISDLARIESGRLSLSRSPVDIEEVTRAARQGLEPILHSRGIGLQIILPPDLPPLQGDPFRIRQMLMSLITGLVKQIEGTAMELVAVARGSMVEVTLREAARGMPVEALPAGFSRLEGAASELDPGAVGDINLTLARGLALLHGGSMRIGRDAEGALSASFTLPAAPADARPHPERGQDLHKTT